jgi:hypothetical protein
MSSLEQQRMKPVLKLNLARLLIAAVLVMNVQCALLFLLQPGPYAAGFDMPGPLGEAMLRGMGVLFLMWNVPYAVALWHPLRMRIALYEALVMQTIGLCGETLVRSLLPADYFMTRLSLGRFILFDAFGLLALLGAVWLVHLKTTSPLDLS